ncbi:hypothetical protein NB636_05215 [Oxalobacter aliiformigenes]|uniref:hypothetical protein n=1 Tax=Oxalobacter aliiformigenes TaxID=2946593 RepID=UPI0022AF00B0|nr:hypothetical protein [Oxalobacter aliiformigenes]WAW00245.1 hypothetical protein NB636_05215 [Oxalobacter aliiformigenes]
MEYGRNGFVSSGNIEIQIFDGARIPKYNSILAGKFDLVIAALQISDKSVSTGLCADLT